MLERRNSFFFFLIFMTTKTAAFCLVVGRASALLTLCLALASPFISEGANAPYLAPAPPSVWGRIALGEPALSKNPDTNAAQLAATLGPIAARQIQLNAVSPTATTTGVRENALRQLRQRAGADVQVAYRPGHPTVMRIRGASLEPAAGGFARAALDKQDQRTALNFLRANRELLRLADPENELRLDKREQDELGLRHLRYHQTFRGLEVWPAGASVHVNAAGAVTLFEGAYVPTPAGVSTQPAISLAEAIQRARESIVGGAGAATKAESLMIYAPLDAAPRLAWSMDLTLDLTRAWRVVVDAQEGRVLSRASLCLDVNVVASAKDLSGQTRSFNAWSAEGKFSLVDTTKPMYNPAFDPIADPHGAISIFDARNVNQNALQTIYLVDSTSVTDWLPDAVSALVNFANTYDYYLQKHHRNSIDGKGGNVQAVVRIAELDNAFWSGDAKMMFFGNVRPYPLALDVVGHELTHGVTQNSADLIYELQPGAMNEAFSDIFGEMVEARTRGQTDWLLGEDLGTPFRDMKNPGSIKFGSKPLPGKMSEFFNLANDANNDYGGVHINSSIINHAYYMLAEGLAGALGIADAEKIFYRCLTVHLQKQSQFIDARLGCIASAEELFGAGSTQAVKVGQAFDAVEIYDQPATPDPTPIPVVQGADSALFVSWDSWYGKMALGRYEIAKGDPEGGIALVESVQTARPAVSGDGSFALFVDSAWDLCGVDTADPNTLQCTGNQGYVHSVAVSPDARYYAFVLRNPSTGQALNQINIFDFVKNTTASYDLVSPVIDAKPVGTVLYADSMVFTADSKQLIYDAVTELKFGSGATVQRWSIFRLDLATETTRVLVSPQEGADFGNPSIGRAGNRYLAFDARSTTTGVDAIVVLDLFTGEAGIVAQISNGIGYPCFTGDESAVIFSAPDSVSTWTGRSLYRQPLSANRLAANGSASLWLKDSTVGVVYRRGTFVGTNSLPNVALQSPANGSAFAVAAPIVIEATAADVDGTVAKVEFYEGSDKIGESQSAPYKYTWNAPAAGGYRLSARAIDNLGGSSDSAAVAITVGTGARLMLAASLNASHGLSIAISAPAGNYTLQQSSDLVHWSDTQTVTVGAAGAATVAPAGAPASQQGWFYRLRAN
jgi:bacillolysin